MSFLDKIHEELAKQKPIKEGEKVPSAAVLMKGVDVDLASFFRNKTGIIFGVPGAFTKVCSETHLPGFRDNAEVLKTMVDLVACLSLNDPYVLKAWANQLQITDHFVLLSDYNGDLTRRLGLLTHYDKERLGLRCRRFAMICADGEVKWLGLDDDAFVEKVIEQLKARPELLKSARVPLHTTGLTAAAPHGPLTPTSLALSGCGPDDVNISVQFCGISKFDFQNLNQQTGTTGVFPMTPGHQAVGTVTKCGASVTTLQVGDKVAIGYVVDSCRRCRNCRHDKQNLCTSRNSFRSYTSKGRDGHTISGGLARDVNVDASFVYKLPAGMESLVAAPLVSAGALAYSALKEFGGGVDLNGQEVAIIGFGAVGHLAVQYAAKMGAKSVAVFSTNPSKQTLAEKLGATSFTLLDDPEALDTHKATFSLVIDTAGVDKEINILLNLLKTNGTLCLCAPPAETSTVFNLLPMPLIFGRKQVSGMLFASSKDTNEALEFAHENKIYPEVQTIEASEVNSVFEKMAAGATTLTPEQKCCYVVDIEKTLESVKLE